MVSVGIDLGTTNSAASKVIGDREEILDIEGNRTIRSVVSFEPGDDKVIVGNMAAELMENYPDITVSSIKRHMGDDHEVSIDDDSYTKTSYQPDEISALILKKVLQGAEGSIGEKPDNAVITVPADFSESARSATKRAAELAGVNVLRLLPEPSAACVAYGLRDRDEDIERVAVYDLGGGTFDISLVDVAHEDSFYDVIATEGQQDLGGDDFDEALADWIAERIEEETGTDITGDRAKMWKVKNNAKNIKESLSQRDTARFNDPGTISGENFELEVTREQFEELTEDLVQKTIDFSEAALESQGMGPEDVDTVLLVGGSTKMPQVKEAVEEFFGQKPSQEVNPDEAVAIGAGVFADSLDEKKALESESDDEDDGKKGIRVGDVAPDDLGIELAKGEIDTIIKKNQNLPAMERKEREYTTVEDNQTRAMIKLYQGQGDTADDDGLELKNEFILDNIREAPAREPEITVQLKLDKDGVLSAHAWDESVVSSEEVINPEEVEEIVSDEAHVAITDADSSSTMSVEEVRKRLPEIA